MISLTALGGRALRIAPSAIISLAAVKHGQHDGEPQQIRRVDREDIADQERGILREASSAR